MTRQWRSCDVCGRETENKVLCRECRKQEKEVEASLKLQEQLSDDDYLELIGVYGCFDIDRFTVVMMEVESVLEELTECD